MLLSIKYEHTAEQLDKIRELRNLVECECNKKRTVENIQDNNNKKIKAKYFVNLKVL